MKRKAKILEVVMIRLLGLSWIGFVFYFGLMCEVFRAGYCNQRRY